MNKTIITICCLAGLLSLGCNKKDFLDAKPDNKLTVPKTIADFQAVLDNDLTLNGSSAGTLPQWLEDGADNFYITTARLNTLNNQRLNTMYTWSDDPYVDKTLEDWNSPYRGIFNANFVLDGLSNLSGLVNSTEANRLKGSALFYRAHCFYQLAQVFAPQYNKTTAATDPGIPLRLSADVSEPINRSTIQQTYDQLLADLKSAIQLLPPGKALYPTRPSTAACYALLARAYQTMQQYDSAYVYADACLRINSTLMDYNNYPLAGKPFPRFNPEVIFHCIPKRLASVYGNIDTLLLRSYEINDLRLTLFFDLKLTNNKFIGSYDGSTRLFAGLATDEIYLVRAECNARLGNVQKAMTDLNTLLSHRWKSGTFNPYTASTKDEALKMILTERRKELCFRGLRWADIRRLNIEGANISVTRIFNGQAYTLSPSSNKWVWPIPDDVISFNPGMIQNPR